MSGEIFEINSKETSSFSINNKEVESIITKSGFILYQKQSSKIQTQMVVSTFLYLKDIDGNPISGVPVKIYAKSNNTLLITRNTLSDGMVTTFSASRYYIFDGNDTYKGCSYNI